MSEVSNELSDAIGLLRKASLHLAGAGDAPREAIEAFLDSMDEDVVRVYRDDDCESPRERDNAGVMFCRHRKYQLGDEDAEGPTVKEQGVELDGHWMTEEQATIARDLIMEVFHGSDEFEPNGDNGRENYKLDHESREKIYAAICFLENPDNWSSRYVLREGVAICLPIGMYDHSGITIFHGAPSGWDSGQVGWHYMTRETLDKEFGGDEDKAKACLEAELAVYDQWLRGNRWSYAIEKRDGAFIDGCSGFIGDTLEGNGILDAVDPDYREEVEEAWEHRFDTV